MGFAVDEIGLCLASTLVLFAPQWDFLIGCVSEAWEKVTLNMSQSAGRPRGSDEYIHPL